MMFGDVGHGMILVIFGYWMIRGEKKFLDQKSTNEIWNIMFGGRYVILLLGLFSLYTGFLYNDVFSRSMNLSSSWLTLVMTNKMSDTDLMSKETIEINPAKNQPYAWGLDPIWVLSTNKVMVENSIKMKLSIILGIIHMEFGVILSLFNHIYFKKFYLIYLQFIPELLLMTCLFAWLVILIYLKWFFYMESSERFHGGCAPQILIIFIDMFLMVETKPVGEGCDAYLFEGQRMVQMALVFIALICMPVLLFGTPLYLMNYHSKRRKALTNRIGTFRRYQRGDVDKEEQTLQAEVNKHTVSFGELMIHQAIHTIEYVLSTVSHTASYLRLWALSLAHAALSEMLWDMVLEKIAIKDHSIVGAIKLVVIFAIWAFFTICILVIMEGLSAFLHTLRLHWVEFMTKFFEGAGWLFQPFSFKTILAEEPTSRPVVDTRKHRSEKN
ncbi:hypothetical protein evm_010291 [Chilo suppressalis]|nr:hypothetical protein evm_010291 [Chilo suppressalis]